MVAHNATFDHSFMMAAAERAWMPSVLNSSAGGL
jgi:DNA polymerase III alpha subunit (gram-positive type)